MSGSDSINNSQGDVVAHAISELLTERQEMLVLFCELAGLDPENQKEKYAGLLQRFCEVLVDYSALWHFEIHDRIINEKERYEQAVREVENIHTRIIEASEMAVEFNDKYDPSDHELSFDNMSADLSLLGEEIALRVEAEDRIIGAMQAS